MGLVAKWSEIHLYDSKGVMALPSFQFYLTRTENKSSVKDTEDKKGPCGNLRVERAV